MVQKALTAARFSSRYSSCSRISRSVLCRRSLNQGESFEAQALHIFPSSSFRLPRNPILFPQMLQYFLSNSPMVPSPAQIRAAPPGEPRGAN